MPLGTVAKYAETNKILFEITENDEEFILVEGGKGGKGNSHFKSSTNQDPRQFTNGEALEEQWIWLSLKQIFSFSTFVILL